MVTTNIRARCTNWNVIVKKSLETGNRKNTYVYTYRIELLFLWIIPLFFFFSSFFFCCFLDWIKSHPTFLAEFSTCFDTSKQGIQSINCNLRCSFNPSYLRSAVLASTIQQIAHEESPTRNCVAARVRRVQNQSSRCCSRDSRYFHTKNSNFQQI